MATKTKVKNSIELFYIKTKSKSDTYNKFKDFKINGSPAYSKMGIYKIFTRIDESGSAERKSGSGRPGKLSPSDKIKLKKAVNHKTGQSQRKLAAKFGVSVSTINDNLKKLNLKYRKRKRAPKQTPQQKERQHERLVKFCGDMASNDDPRDLVIDDESYFSFSGAGMPGNTGFYTNDITKTPNEVKHRREAKFPEKVMIWVAFPPRGISDIWVAPKQTSMKAPTYIQECLKKRLLKFIDLHYESRDEIVFWPDLASCHYSSQTQEFLKTEGIVCVPRDQNPPNAPQIRPIEIFFD